MKNITKIIIIIICTSLLIGCLKDQEEIGGEIEMDLSKCEIIQEYESHEGFLRDGEYFAKIKCPKFNITDLSSNWKQLPLSNNLEESMKIEHCDEVECVNVYEKYEYPVIERGYYLFLDRHTDAIDKYDDSNIFERYSYNYSLAIFDIDNNYLYYYKLDT